jgi:long-chain acyl-CoA synthetase
MKRTIDTLSQCILLMRDRNPSLVAIKYKNKQGWQKLNWQEYYALIEKAGLSLLELGIQPKDKVAIFSNTRLEWCIADYAIMGVGAIVIPIYQTMTPEDLEYVLNDSSAQAVFIENRSLLKAFNQIKARCPHVKKVILMDSDDGKASEETLTWQDFMALGSAGKNKAKSDVFAQLCQKAQIDDVATILYTSGTTGLPKGVLLCHRQGVSEIHDAFNYVGATADDVSLTFLPYAHILGRIEHWGQTYIGATMAFAESIEKVRSNLQEIHPTFIMSVPRIFEKIYSAIWAQVESNFASNKIFRWALAVGLKAGDYRLKREPIPIALLAQYTLAKKLALHKVTDAFGGRLRFAISGGASIPRDIALFFHACEILILEGYGLTETTGAITVNAPFDYRFGSVGKPFGDVQLKIAEADGEILAKSDKIIREYYNNPEATKEAITDGWFHTGDIGEILPSGDLRITDRKKDLIKTAGGKYVAPQKIENLLKAHSYISHVLVHGDQRKFIVALLTLDKGAIINFAKDKQINYPDYATLTQNPQVLELVRKGVAETNQQLASYESIKRYAVLPDDFSVESGELTPSLKVKRKVLDKKFKKEIDSLYQ